MAVAGFAKWKDGDDLEIDVPFNKSSQLIRIHPTYWGIFPAVLPKGSRGRLVSQDKTEIFVQFLLPGKTVYLKDCSVYFSVIKASGGWQIRNLSAA